MKQQLIILCGIPFSGKTTLSKQLIQKLDATRIDLDEIKFELFGNEITDDQINQDGWDKIYQEMYAQIETELKSGKTVIHDTGNFTVYERGLINKIAKKLSIPFVTVFVDTPVEIAKERMKQNRTTKDRFDISDQAFQEAADEMEQPVDSENPIICSQNTTMDELISTFIQEL